MTNRTATFFIIPLLVLAFAPAPAAHAADFTLSIANITMVPVPPTCEVRSTKKIIRSGGSFDLVWKSKGAEKMVGLVRGEEEWPADGRRRVSIAVLGKHEFPMTFVGKNGATATCTAKVFVHPKKKK
jgi:hypothetical protein